jgi:hypothetical protein
MFGKGERANLSRAERNELRELVKFIVETWEGRLS